MRKAFDYTKGLWGKPPREVEDTTVFVLPGGAYEVIGRLRPSRAKVGQEMTHDYKFVASWLSARLKL
jgi:hypothetical protein